MEEKTTASAGSGYFERPARSYETGRVTVWIRRGSIALAAASAITMVLLYPSLPERIPTHFNALGQPDGWGSRSEAIMLTVIFVAMVTGLSVLSRYPRIFNYPAAVIEENAQRMYRAGEQMIVGTTAGCAIIFTGTLLSMVTPVNSSVVILPGVLVLVVSLVAGLVKTFKG